MSHPVSLSSEVEKVGVWENSSSMGQMQAEADTRFVDCVEERNGPFHCGFKGVSGGRGG